MDYSFETLFSLKDKVTVVLGGTSGIGQAIAYGYARAGASVVASSRDQAKVDATAGELEKLGSKTLRLTSDVQNRAQHGEVVSGYCHAFRPASMFWWSRRGCSLRVRPRMSRRRTGPV